MTPYLDLLIFAAVLVPLWLLNRRYAVEANDPWIALAHRRNPERES